MDHLDQQDRQLFVEIREALRKLPEDFVQRLGTAGALPGREGRGDPDTPKNEKGAAPGFRDQAGALEGAGFALGRFVPLFGQLAGFSRDLRNIFDAFGKVGEVFSGGVKTAGQRRALAEDAGKEKTEPAYLKRGAAPKQVVDYAPEYLKGAALTPAGKFPQLPETQKKGEEPANLPAALTPDRSLKQLLGDPEKGKADLPEYLSRPPPQPAYLHKPFAPSAARVPSPETKGPALFDVPAPKPAYGGAHVFDLPPAPPAAPPAEGFPPPLAAGTRPVPGGDGGEGMGGASLGAGGGVGEVVALLRELVGVGRDQLRATQEGQADNDPGDVGGATKLNPSFMQPPPAAEEGSGAAAQTAMLEPPRPGVGGAKRALAEVAKGAAGAALKAVLRKMITRGL